MLRSEVEHYIDLVDYQHRMKGADRLSADKAVEVFKENHPELTAAVIKLMNSKEIDLKSLTEYELQVFAALVFFGRIVRDKSR